MKQQKLVRLVIAASILIIPGTSSAWMKYCSSHPARMWTTFQWYHPSCPDGGDWETKGWWQLDQSQCATVSSLNLNYNSYYYYYAESTDGLVWGGSYSTCTPLSAFDYCIDTCDNNPNTRYLGYGQLYTGGVSNYTFTFN
jgi:uncharacterized membrane protein